MENKDEILLGAGELYLSIFTGTELPTDAEIETEVNNVGHCSGGFTVNYKPTKYDVLNQYEKVVKSFITKEEISAKTGLLTWNLKNLEMLSTGEYAQDATKKRRSLTFTGKGRSLKTVLLRFVHVKENGKLIRFTMIGQGGSGFAMEFANKEVTVDAEIAAINKLDGFLASFEEELTDEEAAALSGLGE
ncbi:hypothetical protein [Frisingicoccus sp.]|uniref:hypothetical protein n=1 Tax=Frisingicoccus sp. TaxID=1918627 RepID=UPI003AB72F72